MKYNCNVQRTKYTKQGRVNPYTYKTDIYRLTANIILQNNIFKYDIF